MTPDIEHQLLYNIGSAPIRTYPYPHIYVPQVFPPDFYARLQENIPDPAAMIPIAEARPVKGYKERFVLDISGPKAGLSDGQHAFWDDMAKTLLSGRLRQALTNKFLGDLQQRFKNSPPVRLFDETLLVEDITEYALGPHTDSPSKVITVLFYLPRDDSQAHLGTSIYAPRDPSRTCPGGPHYGFEGFDRVATMPFMPNSMFAFVKGDRSFHGVERVSDPDVRRWLLLYDIKHQVIQPAGG